jgi:DNA polymerase-3 subunit delta'
VADGRAEERLCHVAELALLEASGLTDPTRTRTLAVRFDAANRTRALLRSSVRADLAVTETLLKWCA